MFRNYNKIISFNFTYFIILSYGQKIIRLNLICVFVLQKRYYDLCTCLLLETGNLKVEVFVLDICLLLDKII